MWSIDGPLSIYSLGLGLPFTIDVSFSHSLNTTSTRKGTFSCFQWFRDVKNQRIPKIDMADSFSSNSKHVFLIGKNLPLMLGQTIFFMTWLSWTLPASMKSYRGISATKKFRLKTWWAIGQNQTSADMKRVYRVRMSIPRHLFGQE